MYYLEQLIVVSMDYQEQLQLILLNLEELMENHNFIDKLTGEDQSFLDTIWDYFDRIEAELDPEVNKEIESSIGWQIQQDAETD